MRMRQWLMMTTLSLMFTLPAAVMGDSGRQTDDRPPSSVRGDRPRGDAGSAGRMRNPRLAPEDVKEALEVLRDYRPELADDIEQWQQEKPEDVVNLIRQHMPWIGRLVETRRQDPQGYALRLRDLQLHRQSKQLAEQLQQARQQDDQDQVAALTSQLRELVAQHFEVRQQVRRHALERMERMMASLREQLESRQQTRDELITRRVNQLTAPADESPKARDW